MYRRISIRSSRRHRGRVQSLLVMIVFSFQAVAKKQYIYGSILSMGKKEELCLYPILLCSYESENISFRRDR